MKQPDPDPKNLVQSKHIHVKLLKHFYPQVMAAPIITTLFMVGDVMLGRGIDMILEHSNNPVLYERNGLDARDYVSLAVTQTGPLPDRSERKVDYVWGDAIEILNEMKPDVRIINLETSVTTNDSPWPMKGIHYRMHPKNVNVVQSAGINCCILANNHVADWGFAGLNETLSTLQSAGIKFAGAGHNSSEAKSPAILKVGSNNRVLIFAGAHQSSGVPDSWKVKTAREGVNIIDIYKPHKTLTSLKEQIKRYKQLGDIVVLSIHWGGNWGWDINPHFVEFAHKAIDEADVNVIHGHSSHHVKGIEVYKGKPIIYGCGDFLNDYEGILGHEGYRDDLSLMYFVDINEDTGCLAGLRMVPTQIKHLRVNRAKEEGIQWMLKTMSRECNKFGIDVKRVDNEIHLVF